MSKQQIIEAIRQKNRSAPVEFLVRFNQKALEIYLRRLTDVVGHRGPESVWVRPDDTPAVMRGSL